MNAHFTCLCIIRIAHYFYCSLECSSKDTYGLQNIHHSYDYVWSITQKRKKPPLNSSHHIILLTTRKITKLYIFWYCCFKQAYFTKNLNQWLCLKIVSIKYLNLPVHLFISLQFSFSCLVFYPIKTLSNNHTKFDSGFISVTKTTISFYMVSS